jgi:hypothetical protein
LAFRNCAISNELLGIGTWSSFIGERHAVNVERRLAVEMSAQSGMPGQS